MIRIQNVIEYVEHYPIFIQVVWLVVIGLTVCILISVVFLKIMRSHLRRKENFIAVYQKKIEIVLIEFVYKQYENGIVLEEKASFPKAIRAGLHNRLKRRIILDSMIKLKAEVAGEMAQTIQTMFLNTNLFDYAKEKLQSDKWHIVALGIKSFTVFKVTTVSEEIIKHINHERVEVRREAQLYFVNLFGFKGLGFLKTLTVPLSEWDQIQFLAVLNSFNDQKIEGVEPLLKSLNSSVVLFVLKLCKVYSLFEFKTEIIELLFHKHPEVRVEAIKLVSHFQLSEAKNVLKEVFKELNADGKIAVFRMMKEVANQEDVPFVLANIQDLNFHIKLAAIEILKTLDTEKFKELKNSIHDEKTKEIIEFVAYS